MKTLFILLFGLMVAGCVTTPAEVRRKSIERKLDAIVFPEIQFRQTEKYCVLAFLVSESKKLDKDGKGVSIVYIPSGAFTKDEANPFIDSFDQEGKVFDLQAHDISLREALNIMCELGGFTWTIEDSVIKVRVKPNNVQQPSAP